MTDEEKKWKTVATILAILFILALLTRCKWCPCDTGLGRVSAVIESIE